MRCFGELLRARWGEGKSLCVGLDPTSVPDSVSPFLSIGYRTVQFLCPIVEATQDLVCAFKPNLAFYLSKGEKGLRALKEMIAFINKVAPGVPIIGDGKFGDIGKTNNEWVTFAYDELGVDAVTTNPYVGIDDLEPFVQPGKCAFVLCHTSNKAATRFQEITDAEGRPVFLRVAEEVASKAAEKGGSWGLIVGATYPEQLRQVREKVGDMPLLIPGIGAQGGDLEATVRAGKDSHRQGHGMIINASSSILYASKLADFADAARREAIRVHEAIRQCLGQAA